MFGHEQSQAVIRTVRELCQEAGKERWQWQAPERDQAIAERVAGQAGSGSPRPIRFPTRPNGRHRWRKFARALLPRCARKGPKWIFRRAVLGEIKRIEKTTVRDRILAGQPRIDGRDTNSVRSIHIETGILPRTHGSASFTRGETQALVVVTLGTERDSQVIDALQGDYRDRFMLHYNFPPYCVGETGRVGLAEAP